MVLCKMRRRRYLALVMGVGTGTVGGCADRRTDPEPEGNQQSTSVESRTHTNTSPTAEINKSETEETPTGDPTADATTHSAETETETETVPRIIGREFLIRDESTASPVDKASVVFETSSSRVVVTGAIRGKNGCQTAVLESATYESATDSLRVIVATERDTPKDVGCIQAITEIKYRTRIRFERGVPGTVIVIHHNTSGKTEIETAERTS